MAAACPPRMAAPSWSESNSATPFGASDFSVVTKKSAAALPCALLNVTFHLLSKNWPPNDRKIGYHDVTIGLPLTPRNTNPYLTLCAACAFRAWLTSEAHVFGADGKTSFR